MVGRWLLAFGIGGLVVGVARLALRRDHRRLNPVGAAAVLMTVRRDAAGVQANFEGGLPEPGSDRAARCWLTDDGGEHYEPVGVLRLVSGLPVRETHWFTVPSEFAGLWLHVTGGQGLPVLTVPVPEMPAPAEAPLHLIA